MERKKNTLRGLFKQFVVVGGGGIMIKKLTGLLSGLTFGMLKQYRQKSIDFFKIAVLKVYLKSIKAIRRHAMLLFAVIFFMITVSMAAVIIPVAMILASPWSFGTKLWCLGGIGVFYLLLGLVVITTVFSEKRWMHITGSDELMKELHEKSDNE